jgi:hypothetical protein
VADGQGGKVLKNPAQGGVLLKNSGRRGPYFLRTVIALHFMYYNFARVHQSLRLTPAMEAGVADHVWTLAEIVGLLH